MLNIDLDKGLLMSTALKVRDRTTNKVRDAFVDHEDYTRLKDNKYLTDKNSKEPFREQTVDGKRQRIALKRDVMQFALGDPRRVCYVDKNSVFDCKKANLSTKQDTTEKPVVKIVKTITKTAVVTPTVATPTVTVVAPTAVAPTAVAPTVVKTPTKSKLVLPDTLDVKRSLVAQLGEDKLLELVSVETLLGAWAEQNGYQRKQA
jgi:hypothetical protein